MQVAGLRRGQKTRDRILAHLASASEHSRQTDAEIGTAIGLKRRAVVNQLKELRASGIITTETSRSHFGNSWKNIRTIVITEEGQNAVRESQERLQGNPRSGH